MPLSRTRCCSVRQPVHRHSPRLPSGSELKAVDQEGKEGQAGRLGPQDPPAQGDSTGTALHSSPDLGLLEASLGPDEDRCGLAGPELFRKLDKTPPRAHPDTAGLLAAVEAGDLRALCRRMYNVFEDVDDRRLRSVGQIKSRLLDHGALGTIMTGTGSAVCGIFADDAAAEAACQALREEYKFVCTAKPVGRLLP